MLKTKLSKYNWERALINGIKETGGGKYILLP
jgi:hypothetical protein